MKLYTFNGPSFSKIEDGGQPAGVLITMPERFFSHDYPGGEPQLHRIFARMNEHERMTWGQTISGIPKLEVEFVYLVFRGKVQYRLTILNYERNVSKQFNDGGLIRCFAHKNWVNLCGPAVKAPEDYLMRGFQGFRYCAFIF